jgi:hypothetical protein
MRLELQLQYDRALRDLRLPHYQRLFHVSGCIPREWRPGEEPSRPELLHLRERFNDWYFGPDAGGLFLTNATREKYFRLQNELEAQAHAGLSAGSEPLPAEDSRLLRKLASELRHQMAQELGTAEPPQLRWTALGPTPAPPALPQPSAVGSQPS